MEQTRELIFYRHYFKEFFDQQTEKVKEKIDHVLFVVTHADKVPQKFLHHIEGQKGLYEIRVEAGNNISAFFAALTKEKLLCCFMVFRKRPRKHQRQKLTLSLN